MTGFGQGYAEEGDTAVGVEIKTLNHRHFDLRLRTPWPDSEIEERIAAQLRKHFSRGSVHVQVVSRSTSAPLTVNHALAESYAATFHTLAEKLGLRDAVSLELVARQPGVIVHGVATVPAEINGLVDRALAQAIKSTDEFRQTEGQALSAVLQRHLGRIDELLQGFADQIGEAARRHGERVAERLAQLSLPPLEPGRLAQEVALLAERSDVTEELERLRVHLTEARRLMTGDVPVGRQLDFLTQEIMREMNTFSAKIQTAKGVLLAVEAKTELERLREQIQNIQ